jgi:hypothetical protein
VTAGSAPMAVQSHVAFGAALDDVLAAPEALLAAGVTPLSFFGEPAAEPSVIAWMPAAAVYFRDPDGHLLEYLAMLDGPGEPLVRAATAAAGEAGRPELVVSTAAADVGNLRFYQRLGFRLTGVDPDAFTPATGYEEEIIIDGIPLRDRVWLRMTI